MNGAISRLLKKPSTAPQNEKRLWNYLKTLMGTLWHATRHEDKYGEGFPDVSYGTNGVNGWIELKVVEAWPKGILTPVPIALTPLQANWLMARAAKGGHCFVLVRVLEDDTFMLFNVGFQLLGKLSKQACLGLATHFWFGQIERGQLLEYLCL